MNKFVSSLLATIAYSKHNLAIWTSETDLGFFKSGETCRLSWEDCSYWGYSYLGSEAILQGGLDNYWNDGSA
jgi:hypothetical protein